MERERERGRDGEGEGERGESLREREGERSVRNVDKETTLKRYRSKFPPVAFLLSCWG